MVNVEKYNAKYEDGTNFLYDIADTILFSIQQYKIMLPNRHFYRNFTRISEREHNSEQGSSDVSYKSKNNKLNN